MREEDWPWPFNIHVQFHDLQPGEFWNAPDNIILTSPQILTPTGAPGHWRHVDLPFFFQYRQLFRGTHLIVDSFTQLNRFWRINVVHGPNQFAYNEFTEFDGVFAFGGFATMAWEAL